MGHPQAPKEGKKAPKLWASAGFIPNPIKRAEIRAWSNVEIKASRSLLHHPRKSLEGI